MIKVSEAIEIVKEKFPTLQFTSGVEYENLYVFHDKNAGPMCNASYAVNKTTGQVTHFDPFDISLDDYNNGKTFKIAE